METHLTTILLAAWLLIGALLIWGIAFAWQRAMRNEVPLPLFGLLERRGLGLAGFGEAAGANALGQAVRRCTFCRSRDTCGQLSDDTGAIPEGCPNAGLLAQLTPPRA